MRVDPVVSRTLLVCLCLWPAAAVATDEQSNLAACRSGWPTCDLSRLTAQEREEVAIATEARNVRACRNGLVGCDRSLLSADERSFLAADERDRNAGDPGLRASPAEVRSASAKAVRQALVADCMDGLPACDLALLAPREARQVALAARSRNLTSCIAGWEGCDLSRLDPLQRRAAARARDARNLAECRDGGQTCDHSILSPAQAGAVAAAKRLRDETDSAAHP
jgi:hypothetical protein